MRGRGGWGGRGMSQPRLKLRPGQHLRALVRGGGVVLVPILAIEDLEGLFPGIDVTIEREADRL